MKFILSILCAAFLALVVQVLPQEARPRSISPGLGEPDVTTTGAAEAIAGRARVIDGDTLDIRGQRVRLEGIDAPELKQTCEPGAGKKGDTWPAGKIAASTLERWVRGRNVVCHGLGRDRYGRLLARCMVEDVELNAAMIEHGLAWAFAKYSNRFVAAEQTARRSRQGIWAASCMAAWDYRADKWNAVADAVPDGCAIKGNITGKGRIYHMPWSPWYGRTRVDVANGERWFCNERQAQLAGWRPAQVR